MSHEWKYSGEPRDYPYHGLVDADGNPHPHVEDGDVVYTDVLAPTEDDPRFERLDPPRRTRRARTAGASEEPEDDQAAEEPEVTDAEQSPAAPESEQE